MKKAHRCDIVANTLLSRPGRQLLLCFHRLLRSLAKRNSMSGLPLTIRDGGRVPSKKPTMAPQTSDNTRSPASSVEPPMCGVHSTFGSLSTAKCGHQIHDEVEHRKRFSTALGVRNGRFLSIFNAREPTKPSDMDTCGTWFPHYSRNTAHSPAHSDHVILNRSFLARENVKGCTTQPPLLQGVKKR